MVSALATWGVALIGPLLADTSAQARAGTAGGREWFRAPARRLDRVIDRVPGHRGR